MNNESTATTTAKAEQSNTPFDAIVQLELQEKQRLEAELTAMQSELSKAEQDAQKRLDTAKESATKNANQELQQFKETEPVQKLKSAQHKAEEVKKTLTEAYNKRKDTEIDAIITTIITAG